MLMYEFECVDDYKRLHTELLVAGTICISSDMLSYILFFSCFLVLTLLKLQFFQMAAFKCEHLTLN